MSDFKALMDARRIVAAGNEADRQQAAEAAAIEERERVAAIVRQERERQKRFEDVAKLHEFGAIVARQAYAHGVPHDALRRVGRLFTVDYGWLTGVHSRTYDVGTEKTCEFVTERSATLLAEDGSVRVMKLRAEPTEGRLLGDVPRLVTPEYSGVNAMRHMEHIADFAILHGLEVA